MTSVSPRPHDSPRSRRDDGSPARDRSREREGRNGQRAGKDEYYEDQRPEKDNKSSGQPGRRSPSIEDDREPRNGAKDRATDRELKENHQENNVPDERRKGANTDGITKIQVSHLTRNVTDSHLREIFSTYGEVKSAAVQLHPRVKLSKGYGYVEYVQPEDAETARLHMNGAQIDGNDIEVTRVFAPAPREPVRPPPPRMPARNGAGGAPLMDRRRTPPPRGPPPRGPPPRPGYRDRDPRDRDRMPFRERERSPYGGPRRGRFPSPPRRRPRMSPPPRGRMRSPPPRGGYRRDDRGPPPPRGYSPPPRGYSPRRPSPPRRVRDRSPRPMRRSRSRSPPRGPPPRGPARSPPPRAGNGRSPSGSRSRSRSFSSRSSGSRSRSRSSSRRSGSQSRSRSRSYSRSPSKSPLPPPPSKGSDALPPPPKRKEGSFPPPPTVNS